MSANTNKPKASEKDLERALTKGVEALGGECIKLISPYRRGVPDRLILLPGGNPIFVELKSEGRKPSKLQDAYLKRLLGLGFQALVVDSDITLRLVLELCRKEVDTYNRHIEHISYIMEGGRK